MYRAWQHKGLAPGFGLILQLYTGRFNSDARTKAIQTTIKELTALICVTILPRGKEEGSGAGGGAPETKIVWPHPKLRLVLPLWRVKGRKGMWGLGQRKHPNSRFSSQISSHLVVDSITRNISRRKGSYFYCHPGRNLVITRNPGYEPKHSYVN